MMTKVISMLALMASPWVIAQTEQEKLLELAKNLDSCTAFSQEFKHPFTGEIMSRKIVPGDKNCTYLETMPGGMSMECSYLEEDGKSVARYYHQLAKASTSSTSAEISMSSKEVKTSYTIDGKAVSNPLDAALKNGTCIISQGKKE